MPDIATISAALGSIKAATDIAKLIKDSGSSLEKAEVKLQIAELISSLADAKIDLAGVQFELLEKDQEIDNLKNLLNTKESVVWEKPYYWKMVDDKKDGPFCQKCYDSESKLIRLQGGGTNYWRCQQCNSSVADTNYVRPQIKRTRNSGLT